MTGAREPLDGRQQTAVDWEAVDDEIKSAPAEYREVIFHPLKHVVEVFSSPDPQGLTQELRDASERLGAQLDAVVEGYHAGFARSIQNYSHILHLFQESKEQVESLKRSLADAAKQLGTQSKYMNAQWRKTVSLESSLRLLSDIKRVVVVPGRVDTALAARDWPHAVSCLLEGATLLAHEELRRVGALRKLRSDMVSLAGWIQDTMLDELSARIYSSSRASSSSSTTAPVSGGPAWNAAVVGLGGGGSHRPGIRSGGGAGGGALSELQQRISVVAGAGGRVGQQGVPGWWRKGPEPAYKLVTDTLRVPCTASTELQRSLSLSVSGGVLPGPGSGAVARAVGTGVAGANLRDCSSHRGGGGGGGGGDIHSDVEGAMRHVTTRELVACLAQVDGVVEAKQHVAERARNEMRALIRRSLESYLVASTSLVSDIAGAVPAEGRGVTAVVLGGGEYGSMSFGAEGPVGPSLSPALRVLSQRLVAHVAGHCLQALSRLQHVLVELANAPATTQSSALEELLHMRRSNLGLALGRSHAGGPRGSIVETQNSRHRGAGAGGGGGAGRGGGLTVRERTAYLKEEFQRMWDVMQEELQLMLSELLQAGPARRPAGGAGRGGGGEYGGGQGGGGGVQSLLANLNPVHFLEQLASLAERTADFAENALGGGGGTKSTPHQIQDQPGKTGTAPAAATAGRGAVQAAGVGGGGGGAAAAQPRRRPGPAANSKLTFGFEVAVPGLSGDGAQQGPGGASWRGGDKDSAGYAALVQRALGEAAGNLHLLPAVYLPTLSLIGRAEELLRLPVDLAAQGGAGGGHRPTPAPATSPGSSNYINAAGNGAVQGPVVVSSWLKAYLDEVALEALLPRLWVDLRGKCTAALEDVEAFRAQVGFRAAAAAALTATAGTGNGADGGSGGSTSTSVPTTAIPARAVLPIARFIEGVLRELAAAAAALPPFTSAFVAIAERILERMLGAFAHYVRAYSADCPATRLVGRSDVCSAMANETDALLLREPVAFAPLPYALPGAVSTSSDGAPGPGGPGGGGGGGGPGGGAAGGSSVVNSADLVGFLLSLRSQERPLLVPPQLRPLASPGGAGGGRTPALGFGADGAAAEAELQYFAMRERPVGHEQLVFGQQGCSDRAIQLAALSESLDYVVEAVVRLTGPMQGEGGGDGAGGQGRTARRAGGGRQKGDGDTRGAQIPQLLLHVVQSYKALSGHCARLLRLEGVLLVGAALAPVAAASHLCSEDDTTELHPSLGALTRAALRCSEELAPFLQPAKRAYVFGHLAGAAARGVMWLLPAIRDINSLGVERMIRVLSVLQPPLTSLVAIDTVSSAPAAAAAVGGPSVAVNLQTAAEDSGSAAAVVAAAAAAAIIAVPTVFGTSPSAGTLAALMLQPETRGERGRLYDKARSYYGLLLVPPEEVVRAASERPGRFVYAEWMALLQARVPHRTVTDVTLGSLQRSLDRAHGFTPGAKVVEVMGAVVGAVQAPAERLGDVLREGLVAGKDTVVDVLMAGKDTLVAGVRVPAQTLQRVFKRIGGAAVAGVRRRGGRDRGGGAGEDDDD